MDLKSRYKRTEIGVIPQDWAVRSLEDVVEAQRPISYGIVQTGPNVANGIPCLRVVDINGGRISKKELIRTSKRISDSYRRTLLKPGDLVMPLRGKVGDVAIIDEELEGANLTRGVALLAIRPELNGPYCCQVISWGSTRKRLEQLMNGSALQEIPIATLRAFRISLPPTEAEQRAIAESLNDVDALLGALDRLISKKRDLKQAAMQQLLTGRTRLPGFCSDWETISVGDLFTFKNGLNKAKEFFGIGTPIVNYMDVYGTPGLRASEIHGKVLVTTNERKAFGAQKGDVFFTRTSETIDEIGLAAVMLDDCKDTVFSGFLLRGRPKNSRLCDNFKKYCFQTRSVRSQIIARASYTTRALTNGRLLSAVLLELPPIKEQEAIATVLSDMDAELAALEQRREKTRLLKQGMMQELLTGRTRLV